MKDNLFFILLVNHVLSENLVVLSRALQALDVVYSMLMGMAMLIGMILSMAMRCAMQTSLIWLNMIVNFAH